MNFLVRIFSVLVLLGVVWSADAFNSHNRCKCHSPSDSCWPSEQAWRQFNISVNGKLLHPQPPAAPCHVPFYNASACSQLSTVYNDRYWRANHPVAMQQPWTENDENNKGCIGVGSNMINSYCFRGNLPWYMVNATTVSQVQNTIKFSSENNLRLVVKNTGHDFQGRSTGEAAVSLWLHYMKDIEFSDSFTDGCRRGHDHDDEEEAGQFVVTAGAGVQLGDLLTAADARGLELVVGSCPTVGVSGYTQGGGHGLLGPLHGMAADNIVQFKVVTADGKLRTANKCKNRDLFWALRGGGGGTYGVVVETTMKTFPSTPIYGTVYTFSASSDAAYRQLVNKLVESVPAWSDAGWAAYFYIYNTRSIIWNALNPTTNVALAKSTLASFFQFVNTTAGLSYTTQLESTFPSFYPFWFAISRPHNNPIYGNLAIGSWLMPRENFRGHKAAQHTNALLDILTRNEGGYIFVMLVGGGAVANRGTGASLNPAWRKALTHQIVTANVPYNSTIAQRNQFYESITSQTKIFRNLAPGSGAYTNEADSNQPNWQSVFYGDNYESLKEIKELYDPDDLFLCPKCVGSEGRSKDLNCKL